MTPRSPDQRLRDILEYAAVAIENAEKRTSDDLRNTPFLRAGFERCIEVVGEASAHLPETVRSAMPHVPRQDIIGMRNILAHGYFRLDEEIIWRVVQHDLPTLVETIEQYFASREEQ